MMRTKGSQNAARVMAVILMMGCNLQAACWLLQR